MDRAVSFSVFSALFQFQANTSEICDIPKGTGTGFFQVLRYYSHYGTTDFPCSNICDTIQSL
jgi:hypothetical protein